MLFENEQHTHDAWFVPLLLQHAACSLVLENNEDTSIKNSNAAILQR
jgi:hypothetical protein